MKANMKKYVALLLVLVFIVSSVSACGDSEKKDDPKSPAEATTAPEGTTETADPAADSDSESVEKVTFDDLGGMSITIGDWFSPETPDVSTPYAEDTEAYRAKIQADYNFTITKKNIASWGDMPELFTMSTMANDPAAQIFYLYQNDVAQPLQNGLLYDLKTLNTFDFTEEKWNPLVHELMSVGTGIYGMQVEQEPRAGLFFNKRLFEEAGLDPESPYDLQQSGEWTWAKFEEICKALTKDTNNDGTTDVFALGSFSKDYLKLCAATNNANFIGKKDGKFTNETGTQEFVDALNWGVSLIDAGYIMKKPEGANWDWFIAAFRDAEVAMQVAEQYQVTTFADMDDDYGFVMMPAGPNGTMKTVPMDNIIVMPSCLSPEDAAKIGFAYDLYTEATPDYDTEDSWKLNYYKSFRDERAVDETLDYMRQPEYQMISYLPLVYGTDYGDITYSVYAQESTPAEKIEELKPTWDALITDINSRYE